MGLRKLENFAVAALATLVFFTSLQSHSSEIAKSELEYEVLEFSNELKVFAPLDESFIGVLADSSAWVDGDPKILQSESYAVVRNKLQDIEDWKFQSEEPLEKIKKGTTTILRSRLLFRSADKTFVIIEEHRISGKDSYSLFLVSDLRNEQRALDAQKFISDEFQNVKRTAGFRTESFLRLFLPSAIAKAETVKARTSRSSSASAVSNQRDPRCMKLGIKDPNDVRRLNEPPLKLSEGLRSCGEGVGKAVTQMAAALFGTSTTLTRFGVSPVVQAKLLANPIIGPQIMGLTAAEGLIDLVKVAGSTLNDQRTRIFSWAWNKLKEEDRRILCMTNAAQVRVNCRILTDLAAAVVPAGAGARAATLGRAAAKSAKSRVAEAIGRAPAERVAASTSTTQVASITPQVVHRSRVSVPIGGKARTAKQQREEKKANKFVEPAPLRVGSTSAASRSGARANPISVEQGLSVAESAWAKTLRYMQQNNIADIPANRERILAAYDGFLSRELSPLGTSARKVRTENGLRFVDAPQAEVLSARGVPQYAINSITRDHHNSFGKNLKPGENSTTQILDSLNPDSDRFVSRERFNSQFKSIASDNVGDAFGLARAVSRNADRIRDNPALRERIREVAVAEDFGVFGPQLNLQADDMLAATLRLNDRLIPQTQRTFMDRVDLNFGPKTRQAIEKSGADYDRVLFPRNDADRAFQKQLADEFRSKLDRGLQAAEQARIPVVRADGKPAPIYLADSTAVQSQAGVFEGWVTIPQYVRKVEQTTGATKIDRSFTIQGADNAPTRQVVFANMPGRGDSLLTGKNGQKSFSDAYVEAERKAVTQRLSEGRLDEKAAQAAKDRLEQIRSGKFQLQNRPDGSLLFGPTYMRADEMRTFIQSPETLKTLGY